MSTEKKPYLYHEEEREHRLPLWARQLLLELRNEARRLREATDALQGEHPGSNVILDGKPRGESINLPVNSRIKFASDWGYIRVYHDLDGRLRIQGDSSLTMYPAAANSFSIELEDRS